jgi:hypothetical protein
MFEFPLEPWEFTVLTNGAVLPRPAGVQSDLLTLSLPVFGFAEMGAGVEPFNVGVMMSITGVAYAA